MTTDPKSRAPEAEPQASTELVSQRAIPYATSRLGARIELVQMAQEIERADETLGIVVSGKLDVIRAQMRALQEEARRLLEEATMAARLHRAKCNFRKIPGQTYHLYRRDDGELYFSMLSPDDWNGKPPHSFEGSFRLENDMSMTPATNEPKEAPRPDGKTLIAGLIR